jgi:cell shape-determining protein MreC
VRFSQVFAFLIALSLLSVFVLPAKYTNPVRSIQALFAPVSRPSRAIAWRVRDRLAPPQRDVREAAVVKDENERLKTEVMNLTGQLEELRRIDQDRNRLGDIRQYCTPFPVVGSDPGQRDSLSIAATARDGVGESMPVLYGEGVVGMIDRVGAAGAQVKLCTDPDFAVRACFYYFAPGDPRAYPLSTTPPLLKGAGKGRMVILNVPVAETDLQHDDNVHKLSVGDRVAVDDREWPMNLKGRMIGEVEAIRPQKGAPLLSEIRVKPVLNLSALPEVMVMTKQRSPGVLAVPAAAAEAAP